MVDPFRYGVGQAGQEIKEAVEEEGEEEKLERQPSRQLSRQISKLQRRGSKLLYLK